MCRYLILGGCGYIGSVLVPMLLSNTETDRVTVVDNLFYENFRALQHVIGDQDYQFIKSDAALIGNYKQELEKADVIINLAALVGAPVCDKYPEEAVAINQTFATILPTTLSPRQHLIYLNSNSGYGKTAPGEYATEDTPFNPISLYGETKVAGEIASLQHPNTTSLRLATVFGVSPRMRFDLLVNDMTFQMKYGKKLEVYEPNARRNFVHIRDVCYAISMCINNHWTGVYNIGNDAANLTKVELLGLIKTLLNLDTEIVPVEGKDKDGRDYIVSSAKIMNKGWNCSYSVGDGIMEVSAFLDAMPKDSQSAWVSHMHNLSSWNIVEIDKMNEALHDRRHD